LIAAATIRSISARDQRRRRCTDVITSICVLVISFPVGRRQQVSAHLTGAETDQRLSSNSRYLKKSGHVGRQLRRHPTTWNVDDYENARA
jgi:hypothetical protein